MDGHHYYRESKGSKGRKWHKFLDKAIYPIALAGPAMTIPQLAKIWMEKTAAGVSATTWGSYMLLGIFWLNYGIIHEEKPIIVSNIAWIVIEILILIGVFFYS